LLINILEATMPQKLTKTTRESLQYALRNAQRAYDYIHSEQMALAKRDTMATTTMHYVRPRDGAVLYEVAKHSSDLIGLENTIATLRRLLAITA
jgi:hypothetical protein